MSAKAGGVREARRVLFTGPRQGEIERFSLPAPAPRQVLVRATRTLISAGSEVKGFRGVSSGGPTDYPRRPGYSFVGLVEQVGAAVTEVQPGDRVATQKGHASHALVDLSDQPIGKSGHRGPEYLQVVPAGLTDEQATFAALGSVAMHGLRKANIALDESVAVMGQGVVGQLTLQLAQLAGGRPAVGIDLVPDRLDAARANGADAVVNAATEDVIAEAQRITDGRGVDVGFECTNTPLTLPTLMQIAGLGGRIVIVGSLPGTVEISLYQEIQRKELTIIGAWQPRSPLLPHHTFPWTQSRNRLGILELIAAGRLKVDHLITDVAPAADAPAAFERMAHGPAEWLGVILDWER
ncbi:MAG: hypothetical protein CL878_14940 [Dehalococcoidia bacterium]|nr:hypothetical protein [Dehalococcoidia bacterium]